MLLMFLDDHSTKLRIPPNLLQWSTIWFKPFIQIRCFFFLRILIDSGPKVCTAKPSGNPLFIKGSKDWLNSCPVVKLLLRPTNSKFKPESIVFMSSYIVYWRVCIVRVNNMSHFNFEIPILDKESNPLNQHDWPMISKKTSTPPC